MKKWILIRKDKITNYSGLFGASSFSVLGIAQKFQVQLPLIISFILIAICAFSIGITGFLTGKSPNYYKLD